MLSFHSRVGHEHNVPFLLCFRVFPTSLRSLGLLPPSCLPIAPSVKPSLDTRRASLDDHRFLRMTNQHLESRAQPRTFPLHNLIVPNARSSTINTILITPLIPPSCHICRPERLHYLGCLPLNLSAPVRCPSSIDLLLGWARSRYDHHSRPHALKSAMGQKTLKRVARRFQ